MNGLTFASQAFSQDWLNYLYDHGLTATTDAWMQKTVAQAFESREKPERDLLQRWFCTSAPTPTPVLVTRRLQERLFDGLIESQVKQQWSVSSTGALFSDIIRFRKEQEAVFREEQQNKIAITVQQDIADSIIEISEKPEPIDHGAPVLPASTGHNYPDTRVYDETWRLGYQYGKKLALSMQETDWLNKFWNPCNAFLEVEGCCIPVIRLYLHCLKQLNRLFDTKGTSLIRQVIEFLALCTQRNGNHYTSTYERQELEQQIYLTIFKRAENMVRVTYRHKRKISNDFSYSSFANDFDQCFGNIANDILTAAGPTIAAPDLATELLLNKMNTSRWKSYFYELSSALDDNNILQTAEQLDRLGAVNEQNPAVEHIYFEASRIFVKADKAIAISFYLKYLHADLNSERVDNRQLARSIQKSLFERQDQVEVFEKIVQDLIRTGNLTAALIAAEDIFKKKRKKIELDPASIAASRLQNAATIGRLNDILQEEETATDIVSANTTATTPLDTAPASPALSFAALVQLNRHQEELLTLFKDNGYHLPIAEVTIYAKNRNLFRNQLIESINDSCYEELEDNIIEETEDRYEVNEFYYQKIINLC